MCLEMVSKISCSISTFPWIGSFVLWVYLHALLEDRSDICFPPASGNSPSHNNRPVIIEEGPKWHQPARSVFLSEQDLLHVQCDLSILWPDFLTLSSTLSLCCLPSVYFHFMFEFGQEHLVHPIKPPTFFFLISCSWKWTSLECGQGDYWVLTTFTGHFFSPRFYPIGLFKAIYHSIFGLLPINLSYFFMVLFFYIKLLWFNLVGSEAPHSHSLTPPPPYTLSWG